MDLQTGTALRLDPELLKTLKLTEGLWTELDNPPDLLPSRAVEPALMEHAKPFLEHLTGETRKGLFVAAPEVVSARKTRGGSRPVPVLDIRTRVLLRSLGLRFKEQLPEGIPPGTQYTELVHGPIEEQAAWVVHGDVAAFYSFVDHDLLMTEITNLTGDSVLAQAVGELLQVLMGRRFGLPQGHRSSDIFADVYLDFVERQMIRRGWRVWRYNDDFRIAAPSSVEASRCIDELDSELRRIGLALNDDKTYFQKADRYEEWVREAEERINEFAQELQADLTGWDPYKDEEIEPQEEEVWAQAAATALDRWRQRRFVSGPQRLANRRVLSTALSILRSYSRPEGLPYVPQILAAEPQLTPQVSLYLQSTMGAEGNAARTALRRLVTEESLYLNEWQELWLLESARSSSVLSGHIRDWVVGVYEEARPGSAVETSAATLLARERLLEATELVRMFDAVPSASRPEIAATLGAMADGLSKQEVRSIRADYVDRVVFDFFNVPAEEEPF